MPFFMQNLKAADWQTFLTILIPPEELKTITESTLDQVFSYLNGETDMVTVPLDILKEHLSGPAGADLILQLINSQPACTEQYLAELVLGTGEGGLVFCRPPEFVLPIVVPIMQELMITAAAQLPDQVTIIKPPAAGALPSKTGPFGADPIATLHTVRILIRLSPLLPLAFLLLITLSIVRTFKNGMLWWGIPIFVSGVMTFVLGITTIPIFNWAWGIFIIPIIPSIIPPDITGLGQELARFIVHIISNEVIIQAIILLGIGLALWIGSYFIKAKPETDVSFPQPPPAP